jgi:hypothetical protein
LLLGCSTLLAQRTAYCLRAINIIEPAGKRGRTPLHRQVSPAAPIDRPISDCQTASASILAAGAVDGVACG